MKKALEKNINNFNIKNNTHLKNKDILNVIDLEIEKEELSLLVQLSFFFAK